jgi:hypothetical protein
LAATNQSLNCRPDQTQASLPTPFANERITISSHPMSIRARNVASNRTTQIEQHSSDRTQWRRFATNQPISQLRVHPNITNRQQYRPAIASTLISVSNGVADKSHSMSSAHVGIHINEDK